MTWAIFIIVEGGLTCYAGIEAGKVVYSKTHSIRIPHAELADTLAMLHKVQPGIMPMPVPNA